MAVVTPATPRSVHGRSRRSGTSRPPSLGEVTDDRPAGRSTGTASGSSTSPPRTVAHDGPGLRAPATRGPRRWTRVQRRRPADRLPRPSTGEELRATLLRLVASPEHAQPRPGSPTSTTGTCGATPRWRMPDDAGVVRVDEETGLGVAHRHRRERPLRPPRPVRRARSWRWPRPTATSPPTGAVPLAVTDCLNFGSPRGPGRHVAVRRGRPRAGRRLPGARRPGHRRQRELYNQTGDVADPPDAGGRRARRARRRRPPHAVGLAGAEARRSTCSAPPGTSWAARSGRTSCTATSAACRRRWTWRPRSGSPRSWSTPPATAWSTPRTTSPRAGSRRRSPRAACASASAPGSGWASSASGTAWTRSPRCSRVDRAGARRRAPQRGGPLHGHVRRSRLPLHPHRRGGPGRRGSGSGAGARRPGALHRAARRAARGARARPCPPASRAEPRPDRTRPECCHGVLIRRREADHTTPTARRLLTIESM